MTVSSSTLSSTTGSWLAGGTPEFRATEEEVDTLRRAAAAVAGSKHPRQRRDNMALLGRAQWMIARRDPWWFLRFMVRTKDEHDTDNPYKPFPASHHEGVRPYAYYMTRAWEEEQLLLAPKSRQVMISWLMVSLFLWKAMTKQAQLVFFQSKKEDDADALCVRAYGIWERLPDVVKELAPCKYSFCRLKFPLTDSEIQGVPMGGHVFRSYTPSAVFADEMAFQEEAEAGYVAAQPAIEGGGQYVGVSSAWPGFFESLCFDDQGMVPESMKVVIPSWHPSDGLVTWKNENGFRVLRLHHSAEPEKDDAWAEEAAKRYPGGRAGKAWRAEMDIDFTARGGDLIYPEFSLSTHVVDSDKFQEIPQEWARFRTIDPGFNNPTCCLWIAVDGDGSFWVYDEWYKSGLDVARHAEIIKGKTGRQKIEFTVMDPAAFKRTLDGGGRSVADQFIEHGVIPIPGDNRVQAGLEQVRQYLRIQDYGEPRLKILSRCEKTIWEMERYRTKEVPEDKKHEKALFEEPMKVNDHAMDALRYLVMQVAPGYMGSVGMHDPHKVPLEARSFRARYRASVNRMLATARADGDCDD